MKLIGIRHQPGEEFKKVEGDYYLSNHGRFYSSKSKKILVQQLNRVGYPRYRIGKKATLTHIKVVELFGDSLGNKIPHDVLSLREIGLSIDHIDGNKLNSDYRNLQIVTHTENCMRRNRSMRGEEAIVNHGTMSIFDMLTD